MPRKRRRTLSPLFVTGLVIVGAVVLAWAGLNSGWLKTQTVSSDLALVSNMPTPTLPPTPPTTTYMMPPTSTPMPAPTYTFMPTPTPTLTPPANPCRMSFFSRLLQAVVWQQAGPCPGIGGGPSPIVNPVTQPTMRPTAAPAISPTQLRPLPSPGTPCPQGSLSFFSRLLRVQQIIPRPPEPCEFQNAIVNPNAPPPGEQPRPPQRPPWEEEEPPPPPPPPPQDGPWYCVNKKLRPKKPTILGYIEGGMLKNYRIYSSLLGTIPVVKTPPVGRLFCTEHKICSNNVTEQYRAANGSNRYKVQCGPNATTIDPPFLAARFNVLNGEYPWEYGHLFPDTNQEGYATFTQCQEACQASSDQMVNDINNKLYIGTVAPLWNPWNPWPWAFARSQLWFFASKLSGESKAELLRPWSL